MAHSTTVLTREKENYLIKIPYLIFCQREDGQKSRKVSGDCAESCNAVSME